MSGDWVTAPLEGVCNIEYGTRVVKKRDAGTLYPVYGGGGATFFVDQYNREDCTIVSRFGMSEDCVRHVDGRFFLNDSGLSVAPKEEQCLTKRFLDYFLLSKSSKIFGLGRGAAQKNLDVKLFRKMLISFPEDVGEQKRIVAILDEAFAGIDAAIANTETSLFNARELFQSYLDTALGRNAAEWRKTKLGDEIELLTGFAFKSKGYTTDPKGVALLRGDNIVQGSLRWKNCKRWPKDDTESYQKFRLQEGDVVLAMDRTWVKAGIKYAQVSESDLPCMLVQRVARIRAKEAVYPDFLGLLVGSKMFADYVLSIQTGLGVPHISGSQISNFEFLIPPPKDQADILSKCGDLRDSVRRLECIYQQKLSALDALKRSLLQKAFSGELAANQVDKEVQEAVA